MGLFQWVTVIFGFPSALTRPCSQILFFLSCWRAVEFVVERSLTGLKMKLSINDEEFNVITWSNVMFIAPRGEALGSLSLCAQREEGRAYNTTLAQPEV